MNDLPFCRHNKPNTFLPKIIFRENDVMKNYTIEYERSFLHSKLHHYFKG